MVWPRRSMARELSSAPVTHPVCCRPPGAKGGRTLCIAKMVSIGEIPKHLFFGMHPGPCQQRCWAMLHTDALWTRDFPFTSKNGTNWVLSRGRSSPAVLWLLGCVPSSPWPYGTEPSCEPCRDKLHPVDRRLTNFPSSFASRILPAG